MKKYIEVVLGLSGMIYGLFSDINIFPAIAICILSGYILLKWMVETDDELS